ncbi:hypothetical protein CERSUDRAFT_89570 [Gelatoporia subvermispora B]|uniref:Uncharacterized protein n=1 Tax=Ceriporiopsis subvermispora (strain B) TaxID=914234 RepID=M2QG60_CERS8|nr:hypothetical protein CERSUDRAFT_89570 [Gelatoporia subvermispora B]
MNIQTEEFLFRKAVSALVTIAAPELMLVYAIGEFLDVKRDVQKCNAILSRWRRHQSAMPPKCPPQTTDLSYVSGLSLASPHAWQRFKGKLLRRLHILLDWPWPPRFDIEEEDDPPFQRKKWTIFEGFYAKMGGFVIVRRESNRKMVVSLETVTRLQIEGRITLVPRAELRDKSNGGRFSNLIALIQTVWFMLQCGVRVTHHRPLSILEFGTLGYVFTTITIHIFWMHKPKDIHTPTRIHLFRQPSPSKNVADTSSQDISLAENDKDNSERTPFLPPSKCSPSLHDTPSISMKKTSDLGLIGLGRQANEAHSDAKPFIHRSPFAWETTRPPSSCRDMPAHTLSGGDVETGSRFSEGVVDSFRTTIYVVMCLIFGCYHCLAWNATFPTHIERLLWRGASVLSALPTLSLLAGRHLSYHPYDPFFGIRVWQCTGDVLKMFAFALYIFARGFLLSEMFLSLRRMPDGVFETVKWTNFFPHI